MSREVAMRLHHVQVSIPRGGEDAAAAKAHPALVMNDVAELEVLGARLAHAGFDVSWTERATFEGYERFHARDPFGNRVEVLTPIDL
jgi:hypothetical protein